MWRNTRSSVLSALAVAALTTMQPAAAATDAPPHVRQYVAQAQVAGQGRLTWLGLHVYDAALYVPAGFVADKSAASPFALELNYARKLAGKAIAERSRDEIERLGYGTPEQRARWFAQMSAIFPDVAKGKRLAGVNVPGSGARFYFDGSFLGAIDDPDFARAFFAIWLDPRTAAPQLRASLLGQTVAARSGV